MNINLPRWIKASIRTYFVDGCGSLYLFCLGDERKKTEPVTRAELRWDGPTYTFHSKHDFDVSMILNLLVQVERDDSDADVLERVAGPLVQLFKAAIPIYKLGTGEGDDGSLIACLIPVDEVDTDAFEGRGSIRSSQQTIQCTYTASMTED